MQNEILKLEYSQNWNEYLPAKEFVGTLAEAKKAFLYLPAENCAGELVVDEANKDLVSFMFHYFFKINFT